MLGDLSAVRSRDAQGKCQGCPAGQVNDPKGTGKCVTQVVCGPDQETVQNKCFPKCPAGMKIDNQGKCQCPEGTKRDARGGCAKVGER